ncbi:MAG: hypothetical protein EA343_08090 [Nodularia sp. (in: Bacteria)]|nr:MAG: hypothetical protein EA343_08090 [Nodularia sp. (in: cyanobacteria)]
MNVSEFVTVIDSLARGVRSGRYLFFVQEEKEDKLLNLLRASLKNGKLPNHRLQTLNINELAEPLPNREAVLRLTEKLKEQLQQIRNMGIPQILVLTKPMLLVRYQIGLSPLYEHYLADGTTAVVVLPSVSSVELSDALPNSAKVDTEILRSPFPEVGRAESPLIQL